MSNCIIGKFFHMKCNLKICTNDIKIFYYSDGAASQYKNYKNIVNLCHYEKDFDIKTEWNFFSTSHGKSTCDGRGGCLKRGADRAIMQAINERFINPYKY